MMNPTATPSGILLDQLEACSAELGILQVSDAPSEELKSARQKVDVIKEEVMRRMSW